MNVVAILIFGAVGGILRVLFASNPYGVLLVNVFGAFLLGYITQRLEWARQAEWVREGVATGLIGSMTTFSSFASDAVSIGSQHLALMVVYSSITLVGGVLMSRIGMLCANGVHQIRLNVKARRQ